MVPIHNVLLLYPLSQNMADNFDHIGLGYLASNLLAHEISVKVVNIPADPGRHYAMATAICDEHPVLIGVSALNETYALSLSFVKILRAMGYSGHITYGGYYPTFYDEKVLANPEVDTVIRYEGETAILNLAQRLLNKEDWRDLDNLSYIYNGRLVRNQIGDCEDINKLPFPYRPHIVSAHKKPYDVYISTSRGCYGNCMYCSIQSFYKAAKAPKWRARKPESVVEEIACLWTTYKVTDFIFIDDDFIPPTDEGRARAYEIATLLLKRGLPITFHITCNAKAVEESLFTLLKKAGLRSVSLGIESADPKILKKMKKFIAVEDAKRAVAILNRIKLAIDFGMIFFNPFTTVETLKSDLNLMRIIGEYKPNILPLNRMKLRRGTPGYAMMAKAGYEEEPNGEIRWEFTDENIKKIYKIFLDVFALETRGQETINRIVREGINQLKRTGGKRADILLVQELFQKIRDLVLHVAEAIVQEVLTRQNIEEITRKYAALLQAELHDIGEAVQKIGVDKGVV